MEGGLEADVRVVLSPSVLITSLWVLQGRPVDAPVVSGIPGVGAVVHTSPRVVGSGPAEVVSMGVALVLVIRGSTRVVSSLGVREVDDDVGEMEYGLGLDKEDELVRFNVDVVFIASVVISLKEDVVSAVVLGGTSERKYEDRDIITTDTYISHGVHYSYLFDED